MLITSLENSRVAMYGIITFVIRTVIEKVICNQIQSSLYLNVARAKGHGPETQERHREKDYHAEIKQWGTFYHVILENRERKRKRQRPKERGAIFLCNPKLLSVPQCAASKWRGCLPVPAALCWQRSTARTPSHSIEDISLAFSSLAASFSRSLFHPPHTHTLNTSHSLTSVMLQ